MICGYCAREIPDRPGKEQRCGACGGACRKVHCPWCGYANPAVPGFLERWSKKNEEKKEDESQ